MSGETVSYDLEKELKENCSVEWRPSLRSLFNLEGLTGDRFTQEIPVCLKLQKAFG